FDAHPASTCGVLLSNIVQIWMQRCCTPTDENERAVRYTLPRPGERAQVGVSTRVPGARYKSDRGRFQAPPFVAPNPGKHRDERSYDYKTSGFPGPTTASRSRRNGRSIPPVLWA